jgi:hypothetical protein
MRRLRWVLRYLNAIDLRLNYMNDDNNKQHTPWWLSGLCFIWCCLFSAWVGQLATKENIYRLSVVFVVLSIVVLKAFGDFIVACYRQHPQFSIRSLLIITGIVAIFCSIYACLGYNTVFFAASALSFYLTAIWYWKTHI